MHIQIIVQLQITLHQLLYKTYLSAHPCQQHSANHLRKHTNLSIKGKSISTNVFSMGATDQAQAQRTDLVVSAMGYLVTLWNFLLGSKHVVIWYMPELVWEERTCTYTFAWSVCGFLYYRRNNTEISVFETLLSAIFYSWEFPQGVFWK